MYFMFYFDRSVNKSKAIHLFNYKSQHFKIKDFLNQIHITLQAKSCEILSGFYLCTSDKCALKKYK